MPTYELGCRACGHSYERFLTRLLREEDKVCPVCGSRDVSQGVGGGYVAPVRRGEDVSGCVPSRGFG
jgi:putative FmdB family regulatory protein